VKLAPAALGERGGVMTTAELREAARAFGQAVDMAARGSGNVNERLVLAYKHYLVRLPPLTVAVALLYCTMLVLGMGNGAVFQLVPQRFRADIGVVTGIVGAAGGFGSFLLLNLLGSLKQLTGSYTAGYLAFAGCALVASIVLRLSVKSWRSRLPALHPAASFGATALAD